MKLTCTCPVDGAPCQSVFFRKIGKAGALKAKQNIPHSARVAWGKRGGDGRGKRRDRAAV